MGHFEGFHGVDRLDRHSLLQLGDGLLPLVVAVYVGQRVGVLVVAIGRSLAWRKERAKYCSILSALTP